MLTLDEIDVKIIEILMNNARTSLKQIAIETGVTIPTVRSRINRLIELGVIERFTATLNIDRIWGKLRCFFLCYSGNAKKEELVKKFEDLKQVNKVYTTAGEKNLLIDAELDDIESLNSFMVDTLTEKLGLTDISCLVVTGTLKRGYTSTIIPNTRLKIKCDFCGAIIFGKPVIEYINGGRYYFSGKNCAEAYKERIRK